MKHLVIIVVLALMVSVAVAEETLQLSSGLLQPLPLITGDYQAYMADAGPSTGSKHLDLSAETSSGDQVSLRKAMLLSMVVPGAGQYYAGSKLKGQVFMGVDLAIWTGFIGYRVYGGWKKDEYENFASAKAGVDNAGKDEQFYDWVGFYDSRDEFNRLGRIYYPDRPYLADTREYYWQWESDEQRLEFKDLKDAAKRAFRNSTFVLGLAVLNRVIASIDTYRTVKAANRAVKSMSQFGEYKVKIAPKIASENPGVKVTITRKF